jgi:hypothetical protein
MRPDPVSGATKRRESRSTQARRGDALRPSSIVAWHREARETEQPGRGAQRSSLRTDGLRLRKHLHAAGVQRRVQEERVDLRTDPQSHVNVVQVLVRTDLQPPRLAPFFDEPE